MDVQQINKSLTQTQRHGYAAYTHDGILVAWFLTLGEARKHMPTYDVYNVQNGALVPHV